MELTEKKVIEDNLGFVYEVEIEHSPQHGYSIAKHKGRIIADVSYGKMMMPHTDDDREWEAFEESFYEWAGGPISDLLLACKIHFNQYT